MLERGEGTTFVDGEGGVETADVGGGERDFAGGGVLVGVLARARPWGSRRGRGARTRNASATWRGVAPVARRRSRRARGRRRCAGAGKSPRAERAVAHDRDAVLRAPRRARAASMARSRQVVEHLVAGDAARARDRRPRSSSSSTSKLLTPQSGSSRRHERARRRRSSRRAGAARPVQEVAVESIGAEPPEARLAGADRAGARGVAGQHLGDEEHLVAPARRCASPTISSTRPLPYISAVSTWVMPASSPARSAAIDRPAVVALHVPRALADDGDLYARGAEGTSRHRHDARLHRPTALQDPGRTLP